MNLDDASKFHKSSVSRLYSLTPCPLHKIPMSKSKPKTCVSSPGGHITWSSATNNTSNVSEIAVTSSTHPEPHPRKKKKNNQALPVTTSFQDPFNEPNNSPPPPPVMYIPDHLVAKSIAWDAHRGSSSMAVDWPVITSDKDRSISTIPAVSMLDPTVDTTLAIIDENQSNNLTCNTPPSVMKASLVNWQCTLLYQTHLKMLQNPQHLQDSSIFPIACANTLCLQLSIHLSLAHLQPHQMV